MGQSYKGIKSIKDCLKRLSDFKLFPQDPLCSPLCFPSDHGLERCNEENNPNTHPTARLIRSLLLHPLLPSPELKGHIFTVAKFPCSLKRTFVLLTQ